MGRRRPPGGPGGDEGTRYTSCSAQRGPRRPGGPTRGCAPEAPSGPVLALRSPCPSGQSIPSTLTGPSSARRKRRLFPVALRPLFPKAKRINLKGATAGDGGVFHGGFAAAACRPLPGGRGSAPSPPAQGPPGPLDLAASAPRHTDPAPRPSVAGCVHAPRRQESRPREPARRGPGDRGLHGRGPVSWDVEPAAPAAARFQLRCLRSPQLVRAVSRSFSGVSEEVWCFVTATAPSQGHAVCSHQLYPAGGLPGPSRGTVGASRTALCTALGSAGQCGACLGAGGGPGSQRLSPPRAKPAPKVTP